MSDFAPQVVRQLKTIDDRLARLESYPVGPALAELPGDFMDLPGLRGLWLAGSADNTGAMYDRSGQGRTLTYNGNPTLNLHNSTVPYWAYDGTGDFHSRADEAGLDVLGTETYVASTLRGLTFGGWFYLNATGTRYGLMNKYLAAGNQRSYSLWVFETGTLPQFYISTDGINDKIVAGGTLAVSSWYFIVGRFTPSTEVALLVNGTKTVNTTTIPASIFNSTSALEIGRFDGGNALAGRCALAFLCAAALPDDLLSYLFMRTRPIFGV